MRANEGAGVALDTFFCIPGGNIHGHTTFFIGGGTGGHGAVGIWHEGAHGQGVTGLCVHDVGDVLHKSGSQTVLVRVFELGGEIGPLGRNLDFRVFSATVYGGVVHVHYILALLAIGLHDGVLHVLDGVLVGDDAGDLEEGALEDGVGTVAKANLCGNLGGVDDEHADVLAADDGFHVVGNVLDGLFLVPEGVEQEGAAFLDALEDIVLLKVGRNVAGHEVRGVHQVRSLDGLLAEAEVRAGVTATLLGVIVKVGLAVKVCVRADDFNGVLVGTHGTVRTQTIEFALGGAGLHDGNFALDGQALEGDIVHNADGEVCLGLFGIQVVIHGHNLGGGGVLGGQTVTAADDLDVVLTLEEGADIREQRLAHGAGLFGAVQNGDAANALGQHGEEVFLAEGTIQVNGDEAVLATAAGEVVDGFLDGFRYGTHGHDDVLCGGITVVLEGTIAAAGELGDFTHVAGYNVRNGIVELVAGFHGLEVDVAVLGSATGNGSVRSEGALAEFGEGLLGDHVTKGVLVQGLDLLDFVAGTEAVEEVQEREAGLDGGQVRYGGQVLGFLNGTGSQHAETGLAAGHDILVVTEDGKGVAGQGAGAHVEHGGQHFAGNLVHVRNHEQQALRCRERGSEGTSLEGTMNGTGSTGFALHFRHFYGLSPQVLFAVGSPLVDVFCHRGGGGDRVNGGMLAEQVSDVTGGIVTITGDEFLFFCHN